MEARAVEQTEVFKAAEQFARVEGILPAPESSHAIKVAIDEALKCKETGEEKTIVFALTGTGYFDMVAYERFHNGEMSDYIPTDEEFYNLSAFPNNRNPIRNITVSDPTPVFAFPLIWLMKETRKVPKKEAPFPQISRIPKYSPDLSDGMIFAK